LQPRAGLKLTQTVLAPPARYVYIIFFHSYFDLAMVMRECKIKALAVKGAPLTQKWLTASAEIFTHHGEESSHQPGNCHNGVVCERE
jgi:hypothetical protein